ncbi:MAG: transposase, partial [Nitrospinae bacterium]|nr:transposase [Nitrospinota bacterium]
TRIANQGINLLTTLLYNNVPLTNNLAERGIRPMVVIRKISGGNRSQEGAKTHSVNMSILQTIRFQQQPIISTLKNYLSSSTLQN